MKGEIDEGLECCARRRSRRASFALSTLQEVAAWTRNRQNEIDGGDESAQHKTLVANARYFAAGETPRRKNCRGFIDVLYRQ